MPRVSARERYRELCAKVDAFFARVQARHGDQMACRAGCDACCRTRLSVTAVEADELRVAIASLPDEVARRLSVRAEPDPTTAAPRSRTTAAAPSTRRARWSADRTAFRSG
jgi:uncharacterized protein